MSSVSVCIPCYNASHFIADTIRSVFESTYSDFEIVISDDASTDKTKEVVQEFTDSRIRFIQNDRNIGAPGNWNRAVKAASGEFVGLLNHDDLFGPFWLSFAVHVLQKHPRIGWVTTAYRIVDEDDVTLNLVSYFDATRECRQREALQRIAQFGTLGPTYLARREVVEKVGYYVEQAGPYADHELCLRLVLGFPFYYSSYPHAVWRLHSNNLTHQIDAMERISLALGILKRVFDRTFPSELDDCKRLSYIYLYHYLLTSCEELLAEGDIASIQRLFQLATREGFSG